MKRRKKAQKFSISDVRSYCLLLALAGLLLLVPGAAIMPLLDRDEPKFSEATREMMVNRNWIVPYFNNEYRFDKPVLTYWLMSLGYRAFGVNELGARVHSILSTILLALAVFVFGRRLVGDRGALWGAITMLLSAQFFVHGRGAVADMPMVLAVAIAMFGIHQLLFGEGKDRRANFLITYLALGLGFLAKGPIAILVPVLALALYGVFSWRARRKDQDEALAEAPLWRRLHLILGALVALAVVAPWGIRALVLTEGAFWDVGVGRHVVDRGMRAFNKRHSNSRLLFRHLLPQCGTVGCLDRAFSNLAAPQLDAGACLPGSLVDVAVLNFSLLPYPIATLCASRPASFLFYCSASFANTRD